MSGIQESNRIYTIYHADIFVFDYPGGDMDIYSFDPIERIDRVRPGTTLLDSQVIPDSEPVAKIVVPEDIPMIRYNGGSYLEGPGYLADARMALGLARRGEHGFRLA